MTVLWELHTLNSTHYKNINKWLEFCRLVTEKFRVSCQGSTQKAVHKLVM